MSAAVVTLAAPDELRVRLAVALAEAAPLVPVVARAMAVYREAVACAATAFPSDVEFDQGHDRFLTECGAYPLADVLEHVAQLIGPL